MNEWLIKPSHMSIKFNPKNLEKITPVDSEITYLEVGPLKNK